MWATFCNGPCAPKCLYSIWSKQDLAGEKDPNFVDCCVMTCVDDTGRWRDIMGRLSTSVHLTVGLALQGDQKSVLGDVSRLPGEQVAPCGMIEVRSENRPICHWHFWVLHGRKHRGLRGNADLTGFATIQSQWLLCKKLWAVYQDVNKCIQWSSS